MDRKEAIGTIFNNSTRTNAFVFSTGLISREAYKRCDSEQNFYMVGSMGLASSIGLGIATNNKNKNVVVIEGDASLLMNLGSLATIGHYSPENLVHIVLDNQSYASCSEESSLSKTIDLAAVAHVSGYKKVFTVSNDQELTQALKVMGEQKGPVFILAKINLGGDRNLPRPLDLPSITERFKLFLSNSEFSNNNRNTQDQILVLEESQERKILIERFKQVLKEISLLDIDNFTGIGIVLYDSSILAQSVHADIRSNNPLSENLDIYDDDRCIDFLRCITRQDSLYHDGFIFVDQTGKITNVAQYFVPQIVPEVQPNETAGIRYHSALYGSVTPGVIATGIVSSKHEPYFFQDGEQYSLT